MLPTGARLVLRSLHSDEVLLYATNEGELEPVAYLGDSDVDAFEWLVRTAARHDGLPLIDETGDQVSITCPRCGRTSYHPEDVAQLWCGGCHAFHPIPTPKETPMDIPPTTDCDDDSMTATHATFDLESTPSAGAYLAGMAAALVFVVLLVVLACSPAFVIQVWEWAL